MVAALRERLGWWSRTRRGRSSGRPRVRFARHSDRLTDMAARSVWYHNWLVPKAGDCSPALAAVKHVVAQILHFQDGGVGAAGQRSVEMGLDHFADDDVVVALLDHSGDLALNRAGRVDEDWRAGCTLAVGLAAQLAVGDVGRPEEGEGARLLCSLPSMLSAKFLAACMVL